MQKNEKILYCILVYLASISGLWKLLFLIADNDQCIQLNLQSVCRIRWTSTFPCHVPSAWLPGYSCSGGGAAEDCCRTGNGCSFCDIKSFYRNAKMWHMKLHMKSRPDLDVLMLFHNFLDMYIIYLLSELSSQTLQLVKWRWGGTAIVNIWLVSFCEQGSLPFNMFVTQGLQLPNHVNKNLTLTWRKFTWIELGFPLCSWKWSTPFYAHCAYLI